MKRKTLAVAAIGVAAVAVLLIFVLAALQVIPLLPKAEPRTLIVLDQYASIQEAVDHANPGDTVLVRQGTYPSRVVINTPISLVGDNGKTIVIGQIAINASDVTVSGFTVEPEPDSIGTPIWIGPGISDIKITGNTINGAYKAMHTGLGQMQNLEISENNITNTNAGMDISVANGTIANNRLINITRVGMILGICQDVTVKQNTITGGETGLWLRKTGPFFVYENNVTDCAVGVEFDGDVGDSVVHNNNIAGNQIGILLIDQPGYVGVGNKVYYNNVFDNEESVVVEPGPTDEVSWNNSLVGNYWSDYDGQGTYVIDEDNVDYHPLTEPVDISTTAPGSSPEPETAMLAIAVVAAVIIIAATIIVYLWKKT